MFGEPCIAQMDASKLPCVWTYLFKANSLTAVEEPKARGTFNGGKRYGEAVTSSPHLSTFGCTWTHVHWI